MEEAKKDDMNPLVFEDSILQFASEMYDRHRSQNSWLNGSQIRNLFATALALAKYEYMSKKGGGTSEAVATGPVLDRGVFQRAASSSLNIDGFMSGVIWREASYPVVSARRSYKERSFNLRPENLSHEDDASHELHAEDLPAEDRPLDSPEAREAWASHLLAIPGGSAIEVDNFIEETCSDSAWTWTLRRIDRFIRLAIVFAMYRSRGMGTPAKNIALQRSHFEAVAEMEKDFNSCPRPVSNYGKEMSVRYDTFTRE
jgi:hypothetical protein